VHRRDSVLELGGDAAKKGLSASTCHPVDLVRARVQGSGNAAHGEGRAGASDCAYCTNLPPAGERGGRKG